jgi:hypothetical protein
MDSEQFAALAKAINKNNILTVADLCSYDGGNHVAFCHRAVATPVAWISDIGGKLDSFNSLCIPGELSRERPPVTFHWAVKRPKTGNKLDHDLQITRSAFPLAENGEKPQKLFKSPKCFRLYAVCMHFDLVHHRCMAVLGGCYAV